MNASDQIAAINRKRADEHHTRCHDCGQFVARDRWLRKDNAEGKRPLCWECLSNYDDPAFM